MKLWKVSIVNVADETCEVGAELFIEHFTPEDARAVVTRLLDSRHFKVLDVMEAEDG